MCLLYANIFDISPLVKLVGKAHHCGESKQNENHAAELCALIAANVSMAAMIMLPGCTNEIFRGTLRRIRAIV